jgi:Flavin containing amine oxidoreductase
VTRTGGGHRAFIIGGGLAGLTVAKELAKHGVHAVVLEAAERPGGKASAAPHNGVWEDHGYHLFPGWYANTRTLLREIGCAHNLVDLHTFHCLRKGAFPHFTEVRELSTLANMAYNLFNGVLPWHENLLSFYFLMDLAAEPFDNRHFLDRVSALGFLRSRFYATEAVAQYHHQTILQAVSVPYYDCSAMTLRNLCRLWMQASSPLFSILNGNLYDKFIGPYQRYVEALGVELRCQAAVERVVMRGGRISGVRLRDRSVVQVGADDAVVLAVPHEVVLQIIDQHVIDAELEVRTRRAAEDDRLGLADLANLRSAPMAAWHVPLKRRIHQLPETHVIFIGSRFNLSVIDVAPHWGLEHSALNCIASNFEPLRHLSEPEMKEFLLRELLDYVPAIRRDDLPADHGYIQPHLTQPLFLNTVAAWHFRPRTTTGIANLFIAGDFCRTQADLSTMESAVMSGLNTAGAVLRRAGMTTTVRAKHLDEASPLLLQAAKYAALPLITPIALWKRLQQRLQGDR